MAGQATYAAVALDELPLLVRDGDADWTPIRHALGIASFGVNAYTANQAGDPLILEHDEADSGHEELYVLLSGAAEFTVGGDTVAVPAGSVLLVRDPAASRAAVATEPQTKVLCVGAVPGGAYEPQEWEQREIDELT